MKERLQWIARKLSVVLTFLLLSAVIAFVAWALMSSAYPDHSVFKLSFLSYYAIAVVVLGLSLLPHMLPGGECYLPFCQHKHKRSNT